VSLVVPFEEIFAAKSGLLANHDSWERVELGKTCNILNGFPFKSTLFNKSLGFPVVRIRDIARGSTETFYNGGFPPEYIIKRGDLLIGMDGNFRCCEWQGGDAGLNQRVCKITPNPTALHPKFLFYGLNGYLKAIEDATSSVTVGHLSSRDILQIPFPLPPLPEQRRIVAKLEALLAKVDACHKRLAKILVILKRFRQSVLAAACSGRLTADWRKENPNVESGQCLLSRLRDWRMASTKSRKEEFQISQAYTHKSLCIDEGELGLEELPDSWAQCRVGAIGTVCNGSTPSRKRPDFWNGDIPWVSSGEVRNNVIAQTRERITKAGYEGSSVHLLPRGTVLLAMIGEGKTRGQSAILALEATINQNIAAVVLEHGLLNSEYLWRWFQLQYEATRERGSGSGPQALNCQRVRELPFVLPPLAEQQEIVRRVESLIGLADQIGARYAKAKAHVDKLTPSLLAKAFRGDLVPQDPNDEPASVLLERICTDKVRQTKNNKRVVHGNTKLRETPKDNPH
jgi:type I restriction enzyme S subunit